jgi:hypothetical protein
MFLTVAGWSCILKRMRRASSWKVPHGLLRCMSPDLAHNVVLLRGHDRFASRADESSASRMTQSRPGLGAPVATQHFPVSTMAEN